MSASATAMWPSPCAGLRDRVPVEAQARERDLAVQRSGKDVAQRREGLEQRLPLNALHVEGEVRFRLRDARSRCPRARRAFRRRRRPRERERQRAVLPRPVGGELFEGEVLERSRGRGDAARDRRVAVRAERGVDRRRREERLAVHAHAEGRRVRRAAHLELRGGALDLGFDAHPPRELDARRKAAREARQSRDLVELDVAGRADAQGDTAFLVQVVDPALDVERQVRDVEERVADRERPLRPVEQRRRTSRRRKGGRIPRRESSGHVAGELQRAEQLARDLAVDRERSRIVRPETPRRTGPAARARGPSRKTRPRSAPRQRGPVAGGGPSVPLSVRLRPASARNRAARSKRAGVVGPMSVTRPVRSSTASVTVLPGVTFRSTKTARPRAMSMRETSSAAAAVCEAGALSRFPAGQKVVDVHRAVGSALDCHASHRPGRSPALRRAATAAARRRP